MKARAKIAIGSAVASFLVLTACSTASRAPASTTATGEGAAPKFLSDLPLPPAGQNAVSIVHDESPSESLNTIQPKVASAGGAMTETPPPSVASLSPPPVETSQEASPPAPNSPASPGTDVASAETAPPAPSTDRAPAQAKEQPVAVPPAPESPPMVQQEENNPPPQLARTHRDRAAPVVAPVNPGVATYTVHEGDTLMKIAFDNYGNLYRWREIYESNRAAITDPNHLVAGTRLMLEANRSPASEISHQGSPYEILNGDNLGKISGKVYGTSRKWKGIWHNNEELIHNPNEIFPGFTLYYPPSSK